MISLEDRRKMHELNFLHKLFNGRVDDSALLGQFPIRVPRHGLRNTGRGLFQPSHARTNQHYFSPVNRICRVYNQYSDLLDLADSESKFKTEVKKIFLIVPLNL